MDTVKACNPLWATSYFPSENGNEKIVKMVHGKTDVIQQVSSKYLLNRSIINDSFQLTHKVTSDKNIVYHIQCKLMFQILKQNRTRKC